MVKRTRVDSALRALVEEAIVDAYTEDEQEVGFLTMLQDHLRCPVTARVVGEDVEVLGFDMGAGERGIVAICRRKGRRYRVGALNLEWPSVPPPGAEWIEAYRSWLSGDS